MKSRPTVHRGAWVVLEFLGLEGDVDRGRELDSRAPGVGGGLLVAAVLRLTEDGQGEYAVRA